MQAGLPRTVGHHAPGELVDDLHLVFRDEVLLVAVEEIQRRERLADEFLATVRPRPHAAQMGRDLAEPALAVGRDPDRRALVLDDVVGALDEFARERQRLAVDAFEARVVGLGREDQRRARLVDEHAVDLVEDREVQPAKRQAVGRADARHLAHGVAQRARPALQAHAVAEVVEGDVLVGAVSDVARVLRGAIVGLDLLGDASDREAERAVDLAHLLGIAFGEVVVHGDDVHRFAGQCGSRGGERRGERLALAGLHLGDAPGEQHVAARELHVVVAHPDGQMGGRADDREGLADERIGEAFALQSRPQRIGRGAQPREIERVDGRRGGVHVADQRLEPPAAVTDVAADPAHGLAHGALEPVLALLDAFGVEAVAQDRRHRQRPLPRTSVKP